MPQPAQVKPASPAAYLGFILLGAFLGGVLGLALAPGQQLGRNPDPQAQTFDAILRPFAIGIGIAMAGFGAALGGGLGAVVGVIVVRKPAGDPSAAPLDRPMPASVDQELARLEHEKAMLEGRIHELRSQRPS